MKGLIKSATKVLLVLTTALFVAEAITEAGKKKNNQKEYWD